MLHLHLKARMLKTPTSLDEGSNFDSPILRLVDIQIISFTVSAYLKFSSLIQCFFAKKKTLSH
jgi:hypothetical protein